MVNALTKRDICGIFQLLPLAFEKMALWLRYTAEPSLYQVIPVRISLFMAYFSRYLFFSELPSREAVRPLEGFLGLLKRI